VQGDIFALGVMLYQMTVGDLSKPLATGWERDVSDPLLREDIAACVDVDPSRRFASAEELARRLGSFPARKRAARWARIRHVVKTAAAVVGVLVIVATVATAYHLHNVNVERAKTQRALETAAASLAFLTDEVLANAAPEKVHDAGVLKQIVRTMIDPAAAEAGTRFKGKPLIEASVRHVIAVAYRKAGEAKLALAQIDKAVELRKWELGEDDRETLRSQDFRAVVLESMGLRKEALKLHKDTLDRRTRVLGEADPDTLTSMNNYAMVLRALGSADKAEPLMRAALERRERVLGPDDPDTLMSLNNHALILQALKRTEEARPLHKKALDARTRVLGPDHPDTLASMHNYALVMAPPEQAKPLLKAAFDGRKRVLGPAHRNTLLSQIAYGYLLSTMGDNSQAETLFKDAMDVSTEVNKRDHPLTLQAINGYVITLNGQGKADKAQPYAREAVDLAVANPNMGPQHPDTVQYVINYVKTLEILQDHQKAAAIREQYHVVE
jgi:tetratricopeptide (TPR) repeat protein